MVEEDYKSIIRLLRKQTLKLLEESHYIAIHDDQPIWIAWTNPIFPEQTIERLNSEISMKILKIREEEQKKRTDKPII